MNRLPPHSPESERGVIGCLLLAPSDSISTCLDVMGAESGWLYEPRHAIVYDTVRALVHRQGGERLDLVQIVAALEASGELEKVGGFQYLSSAMDAVPSAANLRFYLETVRDTWKRRQLIQAGTHIVQLGYETEDAREACDAAEAELGKVTRAAAVSGVLDGPAAALAAVAHAEEMHNEASAPSATLVRTGLPTLDQFTSLRAGHLCLIAARPGVGKSSLAGQIAVNVCGDGGAVGFISLEMTGPEVAFRMVSMLSRVSGGDIRKGMTADSYASFQQAADRLAEYRIWIESGAGLNIFHVKRRLRDLRLRKGITLGIVDYLQLVGGDRKYSKREEEVASVSRGLKALAMELEIPLLVLAQINREGATGRPGMHMLRESGALEADANHVWILWQPEETPENPNAPRVKLLIEKQRGGQAGPGIEVGLIFDKPVTMFREEAFE